MDGNKVVPMATPKKIRIAMEILNLLILCFMAGIMRLSVQKVCEGLQAKEFLSQITVLPAVPDFILLGTLASFILLAAVILLRRRLSAEFKLSMVWMAVLEIVFCMSATRCLNMNYNGLVLFVIADLMDWFRGKRQKLLFFGLMFGLYLCADFNLMSNQLVLIPFDEFLFYYRTDVQNMILGLKGILTSANVILFVLYVVLLIQEQMRENERILSLNDQLEYANEQLKIYALESERMAETRERNRLAREIHDTLGHVLTGISAGVDACIALIDISPEQTKVQLNRIGDVARQGIKDVRRSVGKLRPDALERLNLTEALKKMIEDITLTTHTHIVLDIQTKTMKFNADEEEVIYRVVQESITNAIRHGNADQISVVISRKEERLTLMIRDNGIGCEEVHAGFGLKHMRERLELLGGTLSYHGADGFTITAQIPIRWGEEYD